MKSPAEFIFEINKPVVCAAIHAGTNLSVRCRDNLAINNDIKFREEDPYTDLLAKLFPNNIIGNYSRFEFDINRKRESSFYLKPEDAWGLEVRKDQPELDLINFSYKKYDDFYEDLFIYFKEIRQRFNRIFVFDIHSFNYQREGLKEPDDHFPDIILGTSNMPVYSDQLVDKLEDHFSKHIINGKLLKVRKNIKFTGGWFPRWLHYTFPDCVCCLSVEFKKIFMDEWSGELFPEKFSILEKALSSSFPIIENYLKKIN